MPYIELKTNIKIKDKTALKSKLGELITIIPGKSEAVTMISLEDEKSLYFAGNDDPCVMVKTFVNATSDRTMDKEYCLAVVDYLVEVLNVSYKRIYVTVDALDFWFVKR